MCCEERGHQGHGHAGYLGAAHCGCGERIGHGPCFPSREERIAHLERTLEHLQQSSKHVEECLAKMREEA